MTLSEAIVDVYTRTGEQSDLDPYVNGAVNLGTQGAALLREAINQGTRIVATWKFPNGNRQRFRALEATANRCLRVMEGTLLGAVGVPWYIESGTTRMILVPPTYTPAGGALTVENLENFVITLTFGDGTTEEHDLIAYGTEVIGGIAYQGFYTSEAPIGNVEQDVTFVISHAKWPILEDGLPTDWTYGTVETLPYLAVSLPNYYELMNVMAIENRSYLNRADDADASFEGSRYTMGTPAEFKKEGNAILFDVAPDVNTWMQFFYWRYPRPCTALDHQIELPLAYHEAVVLWASWWSYRRIEANTSAYSTWKSLESLMSVLRPQHEFEQERDGKLWPTSG